MADKSSMFEEVKVKQAKHPKCLVKNYFTANSIRAIGFLCVAAILLQAMPSASSFHLSFAGNEPGGVVNIKIKNKNAPDISITIDSTDSSDVSSSSDENKLVCKLHGSGERIMETTLQPTEEIEAIEQIETTTEEIQTTTEAFETTETNEELQTTTISNPKDLILQTWREDENETKRLILKHYGDIDGSQDFRPLSAASERCNEKVAKMLIENGANVNFKDGGGWSPIHVATHNNCKTIIPLLIESGADLNAKTYAGRSALDIAKSNGRQEIAGLLLTMALQKDQPTPTTGEYHTSTVPPTTGEYHTSTVPPTTGEYHTSCEYFEDCSEESSEASGEEYEIYDGSRIIE